MTTYFKYTRLVLIAATLLSLASCLKKDDIPNLATVDPVIEFPLGGPGLVKNTLSGFSTDVVDTVIALNIASPDPLSRDIIVSIKTDDGAVTKYNADNNTTYTALPATLLQLESSDITIKAGYRVGKIKVKIKFNQFDPAKKYMLALAITNAPGLIISANFGKFLWEFVVKNPYEGNYRETGSIDLYNGADQASGIAATRTFDRIIPAATVNGTTLLTQMADLANEMNMSVNSATNAVTVSPAAANSFAVVENFGACTYNPATKTFSLKYRYFNGAGALRIITQTMVKQ